MSANPRRRCSDTSNRESKVLTSQLRCDEEFVISSVADHFSGHWLQGEDPPDAYLQMDDKIIAVEISKLTQQVRDRKGVFSPRLSEDFPAMRLVDDLNNELQADLPDGLVVILAITSPILMKYKKVKALLKNEVVDLISGLCGSEIEKVILDNRITIRVEVCAEPSGRKIFGVCENANSSRDILENA